MTSDSTGTTLLHLPIVNDQHAAAILLIHAGTNMRLLDARSHTPIRLAVQLGGALTAALLLSAESPANPSTENEVKFFVIVSLSGFLKEEDGRGSYDLRLHRLASILFANTPTSYMCKQVAPLLTGYFLGQSQNKILRRTPVTPCARCFHSCQGIHHAAT